MNYLPKIKKVLTILLVLISNITFSQTVLTVEEAVDKAISVNKNLSATDLMIKQQKQLVKAAFNLPNPEFFWESPTGNFYTGMVTQSIEFPTVYGKQVQLQKQQVVIAEKEKVLSRSQIAYQIHLLYLAIQYNNALKNELHIQDSVFNQLQLASQRQFDAGQIDFLQKSYTQNEYGELHNQYQQAFILSDALKTQLNYLTGQDETFHTVPLQAQSLPESFLLSMDSSVIAQNPALGILKQEIEVNQRNLELQKSKALPGLAFGYFNQGERSTPTGLRFRFGLTIPLWFWQYKSNIQAAKTGTEMAEQKTAGFKQQLSNELAGLNNEVKVNLQSYNYYKLTGLPRSEEIINTARRLFESGENDYINYLRNVSSAWQSKLKYLETINNLNKNIITINFLTGKL